MAQQLKTNHEIVSDKAKNPVTTSEYIKHGNKWLNDAVNEATAEVAKKANKDYVDAELAKKANAADLTALETTVSGKADSSTVAGISDRVTQNTTKTVDLQAQIDNLVIEAGGDSNPEVIQARTDATGTTHTTLKDRIDSEVTDLKSEINESDSRLSESIVENKKTIENFFNGSGIPVDLIFTKGYIGTDGIYIDNEEGKSYVTDYINSENIDSVTASNEYYVNVCFYNLEKEFVKTETYFGGNHNIKNYGYYRLSVNRIDWDVIDEHEVKNNVKLINKNNYNIKDALLDEKLNSLIDEENIYVNYTVEKGALDEYGIETENATGQLYRSAFIISNNISELKVDSKGHVYVYYYNNDKIFVKREDFYEGDYPLSHEGFIRVCVNNKNWEVIGSEQVFELCNLVILNPFVKLENEITDSKASIFNHLPRLDLYGETDGMSKENSKIMSYTYKGGEDYHSSDREHGVIYYGWAKVKWQGSSSIAYSKKNYTISLYTDSGATSTEKIQFKESWGSQSKYCLKANVVDASHARNIICAKLWGMLVKSRTEQSVSKQNFGTLVNGGAIDGYPIRLFINDKYKGIYTMNIPKDKWMFALSGNNSECVLCADEHSQTTKFWEAFRLDDETNWSHEVMPSDTSWIENSFNAIYNALTISDPTEKKKALEDCLDIESVIDYGIFIQLLCAMDNDDKNTLYVTKDKVKWSVSAYDLDSTLGNYWNGCSYVKYNGFLDLWDGNRLLRDVKYLYKDKYKLRYKYIRDNIINEGTVSYLFSEFGIDIPPYLLNQEQVLYADIPGSNTSNLAQIDSFLRARFEVIDKMIDEI